MPVKKIFFNTNTWKRWSQAQENLTGSTGSDYSSGSGSKVLRKKTASDNNLDPDPTLRLVPARYFVILPGHKQCICRKLMLEKDHPAPENPNPDATI